jgi:hypothetical protein
MEKYPLASMGGRPVEKRPVVRDSLANKDQSLQGGTHRCGSNMLGEREDNGKNLFAGCFGEPAATAFCGD